MAPPNHAERRAGRGGTDSLRFRDAPQQALRLLPASGPTMPGMDAPAEHRILVVDDEPNIVDVVSMALRYQGFEVASAGTGQEALDQVEAFRPHLMVLDVMLPDMEGFDVAEKLGHRRADVPIIFLTARDATPDKIRGLTSGGDDYVTKPFSLEELVARIRTILRRTGRIEQRSHVLAFEDLQ